MKSNKQPFISVLMPVYNGEKFLRQAIESILNQTYDRFELLILNDGSTDSSRIIAQSLSDQRVKIIDNETNKGLISTLNNGITQSKGEWIARMDADDIAEPTRFEEQINYLLSHPETGICGTWGRWMDTNGQLSKQFVTQTEDRYLQIALLFSCPLIHPSVIIRKDLLSKERYDPLFQHAEDYELWCRLARLTQISVINRPLLRYRWHTQNISNIRSAEQKQLHLQICKTELQALAIDPTDEELALHRLSFDCKERKTPVSTEEMSRFNRWNERLIKANEKAKRYDPIAFEAFLWCRWTVLCLQTKQPLQVFRFKGRICHPKIARQWIRQMVLTVQK